MRAKDDLPPEVGGTPFVEIHLRARLYLDETEQGTPCVGTLLRSARGFASRRCWFPVLIVPGQERFEVLLPLVAEMSASHNAQAVFRTAVSDRTAVQLLPPRLGWLRSSNESHFYPLRSDSASSLFRKRPGHMAARRASEGESIWACKRYNGEGAPTPESELADMPRFDASLANSLAKGKGVSLVGYRDVAKSAYFRFTLFLSRPLRDSK